jgi:predicted membrane channel-forming protein YqfA (hemolysin III family)
MTNILPVFVVIAIALVIVFTELIKKLDVKNWLKGYRVWIPAVLSGGAAYLLGIGKFFPEPANPDTIAPARSHKRCFARPAIPAASARN